MQPKTAMEALGHLLADAMVHAMAALQWYGACCPRCCGACTALQWYRDNDQAVANVALRSVWDGTDQERWEFQLPDGGVNWTVLAEAWVLADARGCHDESEVKQA